MIDISKFNNNDFSRAVSFCDPMALTQNLSNSDKSFAKNLEDECSKVERTQIKKDYAPQEIEEDKTPLKKEPIDNNREITKEVERKDDIFTNQREKNTSNIQKSKEISKDDTSHKRNINEEQNNDKRETIKEKIIEEKQEIVSNKIEKIDKKVSKIIKVDKQIENQEIMKEKDSKISVNIKEEIIKSKEETGIIKEELIEIKNNDSSAKNDEIFDKMINTNHKKTDNNINDIELKNNNKIENQELDLETYNFNEIQDFFISENLTFENIENLSPKDYSTLIKKIDLISKDKGSKDLDVLSSIFNLSKISSKDIQAGSKVEKTNVSSDIGKYIELFKNLKSQLINSITGSINLAIKDGKDLLTINLTPPELGRLKVNLTSKREKIDAKIETENALVKEMLNSAVNQLKSSLSFNGLSLDNIEISLSDFNGKEQEKAKEKKGKNNGFAFQDQEQTEYKEQNLIINENMVLREKALNQYLGKMYNLLV